MIDTLLHDIQQNSFPPTLSPFLLSFPSSYIERMRSNAHYMTLLQPQKKTWIHPYLLNETLVWHKLCIPNSYLPLSYLCWNLASRSAITHNSATAVRLTAAFNLLLIHKHYSYPFNLSCYCLMLDVFHIEKFSQRLQQPICTQGLTLIFAADTLLL